MIRLAALRISALALCAGASSGPLSAQPPLDPLPAGVTRTWIGAEYRANRLQDWSLERGVITCRPEHDPGRTLHVRTREVLATAPGGNLDLGVDFAVGGAGPFAATGFVGLWIGAGSPELDPRGRTLVQLRPGPEGGVLAVVTGDGRLVLRRHGEDDVASSERLRVHRPGQAAERYRLTVTAEPRRANDRPGSLDRLDLVARLLGRDGTTLLETGLENLTRRDLAGNIALTCQRGGDRKATAELVFQFHDLQLRGSGIGIAQARRFGPVSGALHTVHHGTAPGASAGASTGASAGQDSGSDGRAGSLRGTLHLTAHVVPLNDPTARVTLESRSRTGDWQLRAESPVLEPGGTAHFQVAGWETDRDVPYRLRLRHAGGRGGTEIATYAGTIRKIPDPTRDQVVVAGFTGNHNVRSGFGRAGYAWDDSSIWFPHDDMLPHVEAHAPDVLFFSGDQIYEGASPTRAQKRPLAKALLDYRYKWLMFLEAFGPICRDRPCVVIPDDHDVYQGNLWGAAGRATQRDTGGGYLLPPAFVRMVERTQTSHLPPSDDTAPVDRGIGVYFTGWKYGGVDFAVLEDRKFKSGPYGMVPPTGSGRPDHIQNPNYDFDSLDVPGAQLLGTRQLAFLDRWATDWSGGTRLKMALSQTVFGGLATHHGAGLKYLVADLDSNGWPQQGRRRAVDALRRAFAFHLAGDQHLATLCWHGLDTHRDAGWSFAVPSIANFYPRQWLPPGVTGGNREPGMPAHFGDHRDGLGNLVSLYGVSNPGEETGMQPAALHDRMPGYGIVRCDPRTRSYTVECWPRGVDPRAEDAWQYPGWPRVVTQREQYGREATHRLPSITVLGCDEPVVEIRASASGALVWARRMERPTFTPGVFGAGDYALRISDPRRGLVRSRRVTARPTSDDAPATLEFDLRN